MEQSSEQTPEETSELDEKVCIHEDAKVDPKTGTTKRLNLKVSTWMELYGVQHEVCDRLEMREAVIEIAKTFYGDDFLIRDHGTFNEKFALSAPYHLFYTTVDGEKKTHSQPFSVTFHEILDHTTGEIVESLHLNFYIEILYIINEYMLAGQVPTMTILYGKFVDPTNRFVPFNIDLVEVKLSEFGNHHSKISILKYNDNKIRIIISTANLYARDWQTRTQGLWISPFLPMLPPTADDSEGESRTNFKRDFLEYLHEYKQYEMYGWIALIHRADCSAINVAFIASIPGHFEPDVHLWGYKRLAKILAEHASLPSDSARSWPILAQSSAVGVFGFCYEDWLQNSIVHSMCRQNNEKVVFLPELKYIYPTQKNFDDSFDGLDGVTSLMYTKEKHAKQSWIKNHLYQWKADETGRTRAMPHSKCYLRVSPDMNEVPWFVLSSANLSKGAWGKAVRKRGMEVNYYLCNFEAGVVFLPMLMTKHPSFYLKQSPDPKLPLFRLPYDLPLVPYGPDDEPFTCDSCVDIKMPESAEPAEETTIADDEPFACDNLVDVKKRVVAEPTVETPMADEPTPESEEPMSLEFQQS